MVPPNIRTLEIKRDRFLKDCYTVNIAFAKKVVLVAYYIISKKSYYNQHAYKRESIICRGENDKWQDQTNGKSFLTKYHKNY